MFSIIKTAALLTALTAPTAGKNSIVPGFLECDNTIRNYKNIDDVPKEILSLINKNDMNQLPQELLQLMKKKIETSPTFSENLGTIRLQNPESMENEDSIQRLESFKKANCHYIFDISEGFWVQ